MQERVDHSEAEDGAQPVESSWYLSRDGQQLGPLTDRELSLFADGGNFKPGDLLWTAGLDSWKPADSIFWLAPSSEAGTQEANEATGGTADAVFSLEHSPEPEASVSFEPGDETADPAFSVEPLEPERHDPVEPNGEDVDALVQALNGTAQTPEPTLKERAIEEVKKFAGIFVYLWVVFIVLLLHEWIVLSENHVDFKFYGLAAINALVLGKIMLVAEHFRFAEKLNHKPLIYTIVYKAVAFTTLLFIAYILEEMLVGWIRGDGFFASVPSLGGGILSAVSFWLIFCVALLPFFAYKEIARAVGPAAFRRLLFGRR